MSGARPHSGATSRLAEVAPERLPGWAGRFVTSHGPVTTTVSEDAVVLDAADGTRAVLSAPWPPLGLHVPVGDPISEPGSGAPPGVHVVAALATHAAVSRTAVVLLVRRGGYAVGLARDGVLLDHSGGTRLVQGRTAAGGWSQQRYARRRSHQADDLARAAATVTARVLRRSASPPQVLVVGGDRALLDDVLAHPALGALAGLPRGPLLDVPDPRHAVLVEAARRARCVRVVVTDGPRP